MRKWLAGISSLRDRFTLRRFAQIGTASTVVTLLSAAAAHAQSTPEAGGEANLKLPDLSQVNFLGVDGHKLLLWGILFCIFGLAVWHDDLYAPEESCRCTARCAKFPS